MDSRLMPPSHFDPNERHSLELMPPSADSPNLTPVRHATAIADEAHAGILLCPDELALPSLNSGLRSNPGPHVNFRASQNYMRQPNIPSDFYRMPSQESKHRSLFEIPSQDKYQPSPVNHSDLISLKAENEALKSIIQATKETVTSVSQREVNAPSSTQCAVIEHQTQHISRLHKDLEDVKRNMSKKDAEMLRYESAVATKEKEIRKLNGCIESLEMQLNDKREEAKLKEQEVEDLQKIIRDLRKEKEEMVDCHSAELNSMKRLHEKANDAHAKDFSVKMKEVVSDCEKEKTRLKKELEILNEEHDLKIKELATVHQAEKEKHDRQLQQNEKNHTLKVQTLENEVHKQRERSETLAKSVTEAKLENEKVLRDMETVQSSLESSRQECESHLTKISHLQAYVGVQQAEDYERSQWKRHKEEYEESIVALQTEKETMTKTLELQNIRLQSIMKILTTQEEAINANTKALSSGNIKGNLVHIIIRRWREKVFELMVQCRYNEISMKSLEDKHNLAEEDLKEELQEEKRVSVILENQLSESKAQLEIQQRENGLLFSKCENLSSKLSDMTSKASGFEEAMVLMSEGVAKSTEQLSQSFQEKLTMAAEKVVHLEQRLVFASNRLRTLKDLFLRRDNLWRAKIRGAKDAVEHPLPCDEDSSPHIKHPDLVAEIKKLTQERDNLSQKLSLDSATYESSTMQFKEREKALENEIAHFQHDVQNKTEEIVDLKRQLDALQEKLHDQEHATSDAKETVKLLEESRKNGIQEINKFRYVIRNCNFTAVEEKILEAQEIWDAEKMELVKKLEESQREHARTVVASRQSERIAIREKKRAAENLEAITEDHKKEIDKLHAKLKALDQDNNLLMTTLRQHGLISTFKESRTKARKVERNYQSPNEKQRSTSAAVSKEENSFKEPKTGTNSEVPAGDTNVAEMLKNLVLLTENLLEDSD